MVLSDLQQVSRIRRIELCDAWLEPSKEASRLIIATTEQSVPIEFSVKITDDLILRFRHVSDIKGQRLFEATSQSREFGEDPSELGPLLLLRGPFQKLP